MKTDTKIITVVSSDNVTLRDASTSGFVIEKPVITRRTIAVRDDRTENNFMYYINKKLEGDRVFISRLQPKRRANDQGTR